LVRGETSAGFDSQGPKDGGQKRTSIPARP